MEFISKFASSVVTLTRRLETHVHALMRTYALRLCACIIVTSIDARSGLRSARFATLSARLSGHVVSVTEQVKGGPHATKR